MPEKVQIAVILGTIAMGLGGLIATVGSYAVITFERKLVGKIFGTLFMIGLGSSVMAGGVYFILGVMKEWW